MAQLNLPHLLALRQLSGREAENHTSVFIHSPPTLQTPQAQGRLTTSSLPGEFLGCSGPVQLGGEELGQELAWPRVLA